MSKFNTPTTRPATTSPIATESTPSARTHEGAPGYVRDPKGELFLLAVTNMVGERTFYEKSGDRDARYEQLVAQVAVEDPKWTADFLRWLRTEGNMRSASIVGAVEAARAMLAAGVTPAPAAAARTAVDGSLVLAPAQAERPSGRRIVDSVLQRADEPGELLAYWTSRYGRAIPKPVKRGVADAVARLYNERSLLKYDTASHGFRFGDVIDLVHPSPAAGKTYQGDLFQFSLDRRHGRDNEIPERLGILRRNAQLRAEAAEGNFTSLLDATVLDGAGMTWEDVLSLAGPKVDKVRLWSALIPSMGYMALLRNLRNFDEAGVPDTVAAQVAGRLADPAEVARSRQLPMRFLSAYRAAPSLRWAYALEQALGHCLANITALAGRTLVLVDTSGSMDAGFSKDGTLMRWDAAVLFGVAVAGRSAAADVVSFSNGTREFPLVVGESLLKSLERWRSGGWFLNGGTNTVDAVRAHFRGHDRVVILTDEQAGYGGYGDVTASVPASVPVYTWNLAGYQYGHAPSGSGQRHTFGGLTDQAFRMIPLLEAGRDGAWPWQSAA